MDSSKKYKNVSPETTANPLSKLLFCWVIPFFKYGYYHDLEVKDIYNCTEEDLSSKLGDELEINWRQEVEDSKKCKKKPSLLVAFRKTFWKSYAIQGIYCFLMMCVFRMVHPIVLSAYIQHFDNSRSDTKQGWLLAWGVIAIAAMNILLMHHASLGTQRIGMRCRVACCSLVYRKVLKLSRVSVEDTAVGQLINLLSNDVNRFDMAAIFMHYIWIMPIQIVIATGVMYDFIGVAAFAGLLSITVQAVLLQGYLSKLQGTLRFKVALKTDKRVKLMNEITSGIQVIKMYAWEKPFEKMVELVRKLEVDIITKASYIKGFSAALKVFTERSALYLTVVTYVLLENSLSGNIVFSLAQLYNTIQLCLCILFPLGLSSYAEAITSVKRIEDFLSKEENEETHEIISANSGTIKLSHINASWVPNPIVDTLIDINFEVPAGKLCCIVGPVGSGKSSILHLLLKELPVASGKMQADGLISYASQEPWLFVSSIRNNILFGQQFVRERYNEIVRVCALERDLELFTHGDKTLVGERGVSLSGGQRARINLARAVYRKADIYLFDDPLSAVDTHVAKHLFEECFLAHLKNKTRVLVTHQVQFLAKADVIVIINNGKIEKVGSYSDLSENDLHNLLQESGTEESPERVPEVKRERLKSQSSVVSSHTVDEDEEEPPETQELMERGIMSNSVYIEYYRAGASVFVLCLLVFLLILAQGFTNTTDLWLTYWTNQETKMAHPNNASLNGILNGNFTNSTDFNSTEIPSWLSQTTLPTTIEVTTLPTFTDTSSLPSTVSSLNLTDLTTPVIRTKRDINDSLLNTNETTVGTNLTNVNDIQSTRLYYIVMYSVFIGLSIALTTMRSFLFYNICMNASKNLHNLMFNNILQATMRFFDTNPSGRILNRFSKDMGAIDELLPLATLEALQIGLVAAGILIMVFIVSPMMIAPAVILGAIFWWFRIIFLKGAQDVKRLEAITRSPVFSHVSATLNGLSTIRSSKAQNMVIKEFDILQDQHSGTWFLYLASYEAFGFYLDVIALVFLMAVTFQFLIFDFGDNFSGNVGLVISQSLIIVGMLQYGIRQTANVSTNMTSVERVLQYTKLDKEGPFQSLPAHKPPTDWPKSGKIIFKDAYLRYIAEEEPVLKNLNIVINPGEKVGIVGRTGAGKSSLIAALFRLAPIEGVVEIDELNTKQIGLVDLRSNISIIPQEPVLFSASVRYNLDPFEKSPEGVLWQALENVELKDVIENLDQKVSEGGTNFSAGQRQLMCLARAIIRNNKILVMDEATANVDPQTDNLIQSTIRKNFKYCTVLTIAHRLNTIMDSDKVLVMDAGQAMEFDHPHILLKNPDSYFSKMLKEMGSSMESKLKKVAEDAYKLKLQNELEHASMT